jgi:hypothetical protein
MRVKMVVFAPIPSASDNTAAAVNPGFLLIVRSAERTSCVSVSMRAPFLKLAAVPHLQ